MSDFISNFPLPALSKSEKSSWNIVKNIKEIVESTIPNLGPEFHIENGIAIHQTAVIEKGVTMKPPVIIGANCRIGANAYLREGVLLGEAVKIGPSSEVKSSIICSDSAIAHMNYVGNSIIGSRVNFEAGSITANHFNERTDKRIKVIYKGQIEDTGLIKFGALVGDDTKIGANAVLSPGTILEKKTIVKRLELIEQIKRADYTS